MSGAGPWSFGVSDSHVEVHDTIASIDPAVWNICAGNDGVTAHGHLYALEASGSASPETGFHPRHILLRNACGAVMGAAPTYLKTTSLGEIGTDLGFEFAHTRAVGPYYPKLQVEAPMTPVVGRRLLVAPGQDVDAVRRLLVGALIEMAGREGASSLQLTYMTEEEQRFLGNIDFKTSESVRYVWRNLGYADFEGFLGQLRKSRRGMLRRERRVASEKGLEVRWIEPDQVSPALISRLVELFGRTFDKHRTQNLHLPAYFALAAERIPDQLVYCVAFEGDQAVAATSYFVAPDGLVASQWGSMGDARFLHFEVAIYQGIERAIDEGRQYLDCGSMGGHKARRGCMPEKAYHAFWFRGEAFREIAAAGLASKSRAAEQERQSEITQSPYRAMATV